MNFLTTLLTSVEVWGNIFGLISVALTVRESIWSMPTGLVNVVLFAILFYNIKLYPDMTLQGVFFVLNAYGWYKWTRTSGNEKVIPTTRLPLPTGLMLGALGLAAYGFSVWFYTREGSSVPAIDSLILMLSVIAQYLLSRKVLENWYLWIVVDLIAAPLYVYKGIVLTAGLYVVFFAMSIAGLVSWRRVLAQQATTTTVPETAATRFTAPGAVASRVAPEMLPAHPGDVSSVGA